MVVGDDVVFFLGMGGCWRCCQWHALRMLLFYFHFGFTGDEVGRSENADGKDGRGSQLTVMGASAGSSALSEKIFEFLCMLED
jgi:hypothetical protein